MKCDICGKEFKIGDRVIALADYLYGVLTEADGLTNITLGTRWCQACEDGAGPTVEVQRKPSRDAVQYADYILNHYSRNSQADKICLAQDLERHGWHDKECHNEKRRL